MSSNLSTVSLFLVCLALGPLACSATADSAQNSPASEPVAAESSAVKAFPNLPSPTLAAPEGNKLAFFFDAVGVQIYACQTTDTSFAWTLQAPEASLFDCRGRVVIKHYAGPTWQWVLDGSTVVGTKLAAFTADASAIPELLLQGTSHTGNGRMSDITYIQRLETQGGLAPTTGCDAAHVGNVARVDYVATYYFYRAASRYPG